MTFNYGPKVAVMTAEGMTLLRLKPAESLRFVRAPKSTGLDIGPANFTAIELMASWVRAGADSVDMMAAVHEIAEEAQKILGRTATAVDGGLIISPAPAAG